MDLIRVFSEHPASVGETYSEHLVRAVCFGTRMVLAGFAFLFVRTGSQTIAELNERMIANRPLPLHPIASDKRLPL